jgi:hypothetical protein
MLMQGRIKLFGAPTLCTLNYSQINLLLLFPLDYDIWFEFFGILNRKYQNL